MKFVVTCSWTRDGKRKNTKYKVDSVNEVINVLHDLKRQRRRIDRVERIG